MGLDRSLIGSQVPEMVRHLQALFEHSARLTLLPPSLAAKWKLKVWREFERAALSALQSARQLTDVCFDQRRDGDGDRECIVAALIEHNIDRHDIQRIVADLFLAAADTVNS